MSADQSRSEAKENNFDRHDLSRSQSLLGSRNLRKLSFRKAHTDPSLGISSNTKQLIEFPNVLKKHRQPKPRSPLPRALTITIPIHKLHNDNEAFPSLDKAKAETSEELDRGRALWETEPNKPMHDDNTKRSLTLPARLKHQSLVNTNIKSTATILPSKAIQALDSPRHTLLPLRSHPPQSEILQSLPQ